MTALGLGWLLWQRPPATQEIARVSTPEGASLWAVAASTDGTRLDVVASNAVRPQPGRSFELWALPEGGAPVSLGLLPATGKVSRELTAAQRAALLSTSKVAVSLEPQGGSRTGAPTGPVLYVVPLARSS
jgi:anti-sigma-K factor RskA